MLVTAYYDIYNKPTRFWEYFDLFYDLAASGLPILVFTDPSLLPKFRFLPPTVKVIGAPLEEFELYRIAMSYSRELPVNRNKEKDTKEFFALMNNKIEFVKKAMEYCEDETLIWLDYGILKIMKNPKAVIEKLKEIHSRTYSKMLLPGCWSLSSRSMSVDSIHWRYCGGFFIIPRWFVNRFYSHSKCVLTDFCTMPQYKLSWETNLWVVIESCAEKENMQWFFADHNDSMIENTPLP